MRASAGPGRTEIAGCTFVGNRAPFGGGAYSWEGTTFRECVFKENESLGGGAAIAGEDIDIVDCEVSGNVSNLDSDWGGAGAVFGNELRLSNCIVSNNHSYDGCGGIAQHVGYGVEFIPVVLGGSVVSDNTCEWQPPACEGLIMLQPNYANIVAPGAIYECGGR